MVRILEGSVDSLFFDILHFMEVTLPKIIPEYEFCIEDIETMGDAEGLTYPDKGIVKIRQDVYDGAVSGNGRHRFTIAHELFHLLRHDDSNITFARIRKENDIKKYEDPEWQADAFGGELLVPNHLIQGLSAEEISQKCGVSLPAASYQKQFIK
ncbi:MAG: ImmA/IrrE family metallo-endopeptidase [Lachnospiraceae bacterium]